MCSGMTGPQPSAEARKLYRAPAHVPFVLRISRGFLALAEQIVACRSLQISAGPSVLVPSAGSSCGLETMYALGKQ